MIVVCNGATWETFFRAQFVIFRCQKYVKKGYIEMTKKIYLETLKQCSRSLCFPLPCIWKRDIKMKNNAVQNKNKISGVIVHQVPLNTYILQYWKQFIQTKATVTEIANRFNWPQRGNEHRHDWRIPHNTLYNNCFNCVVHRYIKLFFHS